MFVFLPKLGKKIHCLRLPTQVPTAPMGQPAQAEEPKAVAAAPAAAAAVGVGGGGGASSGAGGGGAGPGGDAADDPAVSELEARLNNLRRT